MDLLEGRPIYTLKAHKDGVSAIAFSPTGEFFASGGHDQQLLIWKTNFDKQQNKEKNPRSLYSSEEKFNLESEFSSLSLDKKDSESTSCKDEQCEKNNVNVETDETDEDEVDDDQIAEKLEVSHLYV